MTDPANERPAESRNDLDDVRPVTNELLPESLLTAVDSLDDLDNVELPAHIERYQQIHSELQNVLSGIEGV